MLQSKKDNRAGSLLTPRTEFSAKSSGGSPTATRAKKLGQLGENLALHFLEKKGYHLVDRNFRIRGGEIDLIVEKNGILVFVEVKARYHNTYGSATNSINALKLIRLRKAILAYLDNRLKTSTPLPGSWQCDLVAIDFQSINRATVCHLPHIFELS